MVCAARVAEACHHSDADKREAVLVFLSFIQFYHSGWGERRPLAPRLSCLSVSYDASTPNQISPRRRGVLCDR